MRDADSPLVVEREDPWEGLSIVRQPPPSSAASFSFSYVTLAGHAFDPPGREGLSVLMAELIGSGAGTLSRLSFAREMDRLGATLSSRPSPESLEVTVWGPETARDRILELWALSLTRPRFDAEDIARAKRHLLERQLRERSQPESRAERELYRAIFPRGHPYRESGLGSPRSVRQLTLRDLRTFHRRHVLKAGALVVGTTRLEAREMRRTVGDRLRTLPDGPAPTPPPAVAMKRPTARLHRLVMHERTQVEVRIGGPSLRRSAPEYSAAYLANEVLGGRPLLSRLFQTVREQHGLAYDASSEVEAMRWGGIWQVHAGTGPGRTTKVVQLLEREVNRIRDELVEGPELERIRESAIGQIPLALETTSGAHDLAVDVAYHDLPADFYRRWPQELRQIEPRAVRDAARLAFDPEFSATVIAGPSAD